MGAHLTVDPVIEGPTIYLPVTTLTTDKLLIAGRGVVVGGHLRETAGALATYRLIDSGKATAAYIATANIAALGIDELYAAFVSPQFETGLWLQVVTGSIEGSIWVKVGVPQ